MQFHVTIDTTRAASFCVTRGLPAWANKLDTEFELPNSWDRKECIDALAGYFRAIDVMPYQNLANYEHLVADVKASLEAVANTVANEDIVEPVSVFHRAAIGDMGGSVTVTIREISYI